MKLRKHFIQMIKITYNVALLSFDDGWSWCGFIYTRGLLSAAIHINQFLKNMFLLQSVSPMEVFVYSMMVLAALTCTGILYEQPQYTRTMEIWRCAGGLLLCLLLPPPASLSPLLTALYTASLAIWLLHPAFVLVHHHHCKQQ